MLVKADLNRCIGAAQCVRVAPTLFTQSDDDGLVRVVKQEPPPESKEDAREAAELCPAGAISIDE